MHAANEAVEPLLPGATFSFAFCPTLFLPFFGLTIPLALASPLGAVYPAVFALGTALPLLLIAALMTAGLGAGRAHIARARAVSAWLQPIAGVVFVLAGLSDTLTYWLM